MRRLALLGAASCAVFAMLSMRARPARPGPKIACTAPRIEITKHRAQLALICAERTRIFPSTFGASPVGHKQRRGDERTPEGTYRITAKSRSERFFRFMKLSYPSERDRAQARAQGLDPGGGIGIHGVRPRWAGLARIFIQSAGRLGWRGWGPTDGCIGLINEDVEVVFDAVPVGTEVRIVP